MFWIVVALAVVLLWTLRQVILLLVWRKQNAPQHHEVSPKPVTRSEYLGLRNGYNALKKRHEACVKDFTAKLQALCPHAETELEEREGYRSLYATGRVLGVRCALVTSPLISLAPGAVAPSRRASSAASCWLTSSRRARIRRRPRPSGSVANGRA